MTILLDSLHHLEYQVASTSLDHLLFRVWSYLAVVVVLSFPGAALLEIFD